MTIQGRAGAFCRHHAGEFVLFVLLAAPVLAIRPSMMNVLIVVGFFVLYGAISVWSDLPTSLTVDDDGVTYRAGGRDRTFLAWSEIAVIVPRRFRGWAAEDALILQDRAGRPLTAAPVSMFSEADVAEMLTRCGQHVEVADAVVLSPFSGKADGVRRPDLVPQRTSERFLASSIGGFLLAALVGMVLVLVVE